MSTPNGALGDLIGSVRRLGLAAKLALCDIQAKYRRTVLGPMWIVLGQGATIAAFVVVFSGLLDTPAEDYAPYLAAGFPVWMLISTFLVDMPHAFINSRGYMESFEVPWLAHIWRRAIGYLLVFLHQILSFFVVLAVLGIAPSVEMLYAIPGLAILTMGGAGTGMFLAVLGARFRDLQPAMGIVSGFLFLFTPVIWDVRQLTSEVQWAYQYNPLYYFVSLVRDPLLGDNPDPHLWLVGATLAAVMFVMGYVTFTTSRRRLYYWL